MTSTGLRAIRKAKGLTLAQLGQFAQIDTGNLSRIERGVQMPTREVAARLANALSISLSDLYSAIVASNADFAGNREASSGERIDAGL